MRWGIRLVAALLLVSGLAGAVALGPDHRIVRDLAIGTDAVAITTAPSIIAWSGVRLEVSVTVPGEAPVFVGVGRSIDVDSYLEQTRRFEIIEVDGESVETVEHDGDDFLPSAPTALDWWLAADAGLSTATVNLTVPREHVSVAVIGVGDTPLNGAQASVAYGLPGGFWMALGLVLVGLGIGVATWRRD